MKMLRWTFLILILTSLLLGCQSQQQAPDVKINTSGIFNPVTVSTSNIEITTSDLDLGEYLIGSGPAISRLTVKNNSLYPLTNLTLILNNNESFGFSFEKNEDGKNLFPGKTGTCASTLSPSESCTIALQFETNITKNYEQIVTISYLNYVDGASRPLTLKILAGNAASLVFENDQTNYYFGELIGAAQLPYVERDLDKEYEQTLTITNAGDLKARNITDETLLLNQNCASLSTVPASGCPVGQNVAYSMTHDCPKELEHGKSCHVMVKFKPLNKDQSRKDFKQIRYDANLVVNYKSSYLGTDASLNGYFSTNSVNIEAIFTTAIDSQAFENQLVVGNRDLKSFRINNRGFRSGFLRKIVIQDLNDNFHTSCIANATTAPWLDCYEITKKSSWNPTSDAEADDSSDPDLSKKRILADSPFQIKDKGGCMGTNMENGKMIDVDSGCQFDIQFQPSVTYLSSRSFHVDLYAGFDSKWKGNPTFRMNELHTVSSSSRGAAKIVPVAATYNTFIGEDTCPSCSANPRTYDFGRIGLMSKNSYRRKSLTITFKNIGEETATNIIAKDGQNRAITLKAQGVTGSSIGATLPYYYTNSLYDCATLPSQSVCKITFSFAPVSVGDWEANAANMYDYILHDIPSGEYLKSYKQFFLNYQDGSHYRDSNTTTEVIDSGEAISDARIKMDLVDKGQLEDYSNQSFNLGAIYPYGTSYRTEITLSNIGTKPIPYLAFQGNTSLVKQYLGFKVVPTQVSKLNSSTVDCYNLVDFYHDPQNAATSTRAAVMARGPNNGLGNPVLWNQLPVDTDCIMTLEYFTPIKSLTTSLTSNGINASGEISRLPQASGMDFVTQLNFYPSFMFGAYDGDLTDPKAVGSGDYYQDFGRYSLGLEIKSAFSLAAPGRLAIYHPRPMASAMIYRKGWNRSNLYDETNNLILSASTVPEAWFYSDTSEQYTNQTFTGYVADIFKGNTSQSFFPSGLGIDPSNYDYVYYMGSIPSGKSLKGRIILGNAGVSYARVKSQSISSPANFSNDLTIPTPDGLNLARVSSLSLGAVTGGTSVQFTFANASNPGVYSAVWTLNYEDSSYDSLGPYYLPLPTPDPRTKKLKTRTILVVAEVSNSAPEIKLEAQDYDISTDDLNPAVETLNTTKTVVPLTFAESASATTDVQIFSSIKIPKPANKDTYVKKRFTFSNPSSTTSIDRIKIFFRKSSASMAKSTLEMSPTLYTCMKVETKTNSALAPKNSNGVNQPMCQSTCTDAEFTLAPGQSCYIEIRYQPASTDVLTPATLTVLHGNGVNRYVHRNIDLSFEPQDPASLAISAPTGLTNANIPWASKEINIGTFEQTAQPHIITFSSPSTATTGYRMLRINNPSTVKASFLRTYQDNIYKSSNPNVSESDLRQQVPPTTSYTSLAGYNFTLIYNKPNLQLYASKECLVGDDTGLWYQKGFTGSNCYIIPKLILDINYINREISPTSTTLSATEWAQFALRIPYYNSYRSSVGYLSFHFKGFMNPSYSTIASSAQSGVNFYQTVSSTSSNGGEIKFKWTDVNARNASTLGNIVKYRVFYADNLAAVNKVFPDNTVAHVDYPVAQSGLYQLTHNPNVGYKKFMYYRIFPVRYNSAFTKGWGDLPPGHYLSDASIPAISLVIPDTNSIYYHGTSVAGQGRFLIEKGVIDSTWNNLVNARSKCTGRSAVQISTAKTSTSSYRYAMITKPVWDAILSRPLDGSSYDTTTAQLWVDNSNVLLSSAFTGKTGYNSALEMSCLTTDPICWWKKPASSCGTNCSGSLVVGRFLNHAGWTAYVDSTFTAGGARCYIQL